MSDDLVRRLRARALRADCDEAADRIEEAELQHEADQRKINALAEELVASQRRVAELEQARADLTDDCKRLIDEKMAMWERADKAEQDVLHLQRELNRCRDR